MSGEEHKKGRVSELEGQQRASGRAMFLLSGPQREGAKEGSKERGREYQRGGGMEQLFFFFPGLAREIMRAERFGHPAPNLSTSAAFTEEAHSLEHWLLPCHPRQEGKQKEEEEEEEGSVYALPKEGRGKGGSMEGGGAC